MPNEFLRWKFVDPFDPTASSTFTFPRNPNTMTSPFPRRNITATATTAINGRKIMVEGQSAPTEWTFGGNIHNATHYEELRSWVYGRYGRRLFLYDHFGRRLTIVPLQFNPTPKRTVGQYWRHTYEITAYVLEISGPTFQVEGPQPVQNVRAVGGGQRATVTWDPPLSMGGSELVRYEVRDITPPSGQMAIVPAGNALTALLRFLPAGYHDIGVKAVTAVGASVEAVVGVTALTATGPSGFKITAFTISGAAANGLGTATLTWSTPTKDGGAPLVKYIVDVESPTAGNDPAARSYDIPVGTNTVTIVNLAKNRTYTLSLVAVNDALLESTIIAADARRLFKSLS